MTQKYCVASTKEPLTDSVAEINSFQPSDDDKNRLILTPTLTTRQVGVISTIEEESQISGSQPASSRAKARALSPNRPYTASSMASTHIDMSDSDEDLKQRTTPPNAMKDVSPSGSHTGEFINRFEIVYWIYKY